MIEEFLEKNNWTDLLQEVTNFVHTPVVPSLKTRAHTREGTPQAHRFKKSPLQQWLERKREGMKGCVIVPTRSNVHALSKVMEWRY